MSVDNDDEPPLLLSDPPSSSSVASIPVTIITGFLGAGKVYLLEKGVNEKTNSDYFFFLG
jgi:hypothetical protein